LVGSVAIPGADLHTRTWAILELKPDDVMRLFKCLFGSELQLNLVERYGLTFSPDVVKSILKAVKLTDLTLGDLATMNTVSQSEEPAATEKLAEPTNVRPLINRRKFS
jgi:hypothetical protein